MKPRRTNPDSTEISAEDVRANALNLLARREHSRLELRQKLLQRGYPAELIADVLEQLVQKDLLSETRFAEVYASSRVDKGYGPLRIRRELRERGIDDELIDPVLAELDDIWMSKLAHVRRKRFGETVPSAAGERMQQTRFLRQRGFSLDQIGRLFRSS